MKRTVFSLLAALLLLSCGRQPADTPIPRTTPERSGVDTTGFSLLFNDVWGTHACDEIHSLVVLKGGKLVYDRYAVGEDPDQLRVMWSASKTFTSAAVGFAVQEGLLTVEDRVIDFFKEEMAAAGGLAARPDSAWLAGMTVKNLLTMSAFSHDDIDRCIQNDTVNWARVGLASELEFEPGTKFRYNSMDTYLLSAIVSNLTGQTVSAYLTPRLFEPLGIRRWHWDLSPQGCNTGGWGLYLTTESFAKMGQFYLQKGMWNGKQLLDPQWIIDSTSPQIYQKGVPVEDERGMGYGYQIWCDTHNAFRLDGAHGQHCIVMPEKDAVVAYHSNSRHTMDIIKYVWERIWPAL